VRDWRSAISINPDERMIGFQCPRCGHDLEQTIARIKTNRQITCGACATTIDFASGRSSSVASVGAIIVKFFDAPPSYKPGSADAHARGCICSTLENAGGRGDKMADHPRFICNVSCPLHGVDAMFGASRPGES
jgi:predicted RNA-binding Zn-ribbon protein involved in translation (DUF1610 family)